MANHTGNFWMTRMGLAAAEENFKPFEDYLGLSHLVQNLTNLATRHQHHEDAYNPNSGLSQALLTRSRSSSYCSDDSAPTTTTSMPTCTTQHEVSWDDFKMNGVDVDDEGFAPFAPKQVQRNSRLPSVKNRRTPTWCVFCKNNGESEMVYGAHVLKDNEGRTTCPILRNYTCPICGISGDSAHTIKYCPLNKEETFPPSVNLMKTARSSTGKKRELPSGLNRLN